MTRLGIAIMTRPCGFDGKHVFQWVPAVLHESLEHVCIDRAQCCNKWQIPKWVRNHGHQFRLSSMCTSSSANKIARDVPAYVSTVQAAYEFGWKCSEYMSMGWCPCSVAPGQLHCSAFFLVCRNANKNSCWHFVARRSWSWCKLMSGITGRKIQCYPWPIHSSQRISSTKRRQKFTQQG